MEDFLESLGESRPVIAVAETLPRDALLADEEYDGRFDPHVWMDPTPSGPRWSSPCATRSSRSRHRARMRSARMPDTFISRNWAALAGYSERVLASVPEGEPGCCSRPTDAFGYFGDAYGYEVNRHPGASSTESEAGLARTSSASSFRSPGRARDRGGLTSRARYPTAQQSAPLNRGCGVPRARGHRRRRAVFRRHGRTGHL